LEGIAGIIAIVSIFVVLPKTIFTFIGKRNKYKREAELEKIRYQKEILEMEIEKQKNEIKLLEEENRKFDNIIDNS
jgi:cell shape-determining protein MreC